MGCKTYKKESTLNCRRGLWSPYEDQKLFDYILKHGHECWSAVPTNAGLQRNGKSCRLRWLNYLRPGLKRGSFSADEEEIILNLHTALGNKWSQIAMHLPGRTDNAIKNYWNTHLKKKVLQVYNKESETNASASTSKPSTNKEEYLDPLDQSSNQTLPRVLFADWLNGDVLSNNYRINDAGRGNSNSGNADDHQDVHRLNSADVGDTSTKDNNIGISEEYGMQICPISEALQSCVDLQSMDELWDSLEVL